MFHVPQFWKKSKVISYLQTHKLMSISLALILVFGGIAFAKQGTTTSLSDTPEIPKVSLLSLSSVGENQVAAVASGEIESLQQVTLSSEVFGKVASVYVHIGDHVSAGQRLVQFSAADKAAQRTQVQAEYESALAAKQSLLAQIDVAKANHEKLKITVQSSITTAESTLRTAENNLQQIVNTNSNAIVDDSYADMTQTVQSVQNSFVDLLVVADTILGIDNLSVNDGFEAVLGISDQGSLSTARQNYYVAKQSKNTFLENMTGFSSVSSHSTIDATAVSATQTLSHYATLFSSLTTLLDHTPAVGNLTQATLTTLISSVNAGRSEITTQQTALTNATQAIATAKKSFASQQIAYEKAVQDLADTKAKAVADIAASEAGLRQLASTLDSQDANIKRAGGSVAVVNAELAKSSIRTPIAGVVANIAVKQGELVSNGAVVADIVNTTGLQVTAFVPASALSVLSVGGLVRVEGTPVGKILRIAPSVNNTTKKVEVVVSIDDSDDRSFVVGQFVTLEMLAHVDDMMSPTLLVPLKAVQVTAESHSVYIVQDGHIVAVPVETGQLIGDKIEIVSDLSGYDAIVSSVRGIEEGDAVSIIE